MKLTALVSIVTLTALVTGCASLPSPGAIGGSALTNANLPGASLVPSVPKAPEVPGAGVVPAVPGPKK